MTTEYTREESIRYILRILENAERVGCEEDIPEGSRYIQISDTLTQKMIEALKGEV